MSLSLSVDHVLSFLLTYLFHSTAIVVCVWSILKLRKQDSSEFAVLLWRAALVLPLLTSFLVAAIRVPHAGCAFVISEVRESVAVQTSESSDAVNALDPADEAETDNESRDIVLQSEPGGAPVGAESRWPADTPVSEATAGDFSWQHCLVVGFILCSGGGIIRVIRQLIQLRRLKLRSVELSDRNLINSVRHMAQRAGLSSDIDVMESTVICGPLTAGIRRPFILVPSGFPRTLSAEECDAMFAHEVAHIRRRDSAWKLVGQLICSVFFYQPLNRLVRQRMEKESEFLADADAVSFLMQPAALARCLTRLGEWQSQNSHAGRETLPLTVGMALFTSSLGQRVERILGPNIQAQGAGFVRTISVLFLFTIFIFVMMAAPRAVTTANADDPIKKEHAVKQQITTLAVLASLALPAAADEGGPAAQPKRPALTKTSPDELPAGAQRFNGVLVGRLASKDVEKGTFVINVDVIPRVWRNSKAEAPKQLVGKNILVDGVSGKWLDVLLLVREGETLETEARHDGGDRLTFPGELLRKVPPYKPGDYPELPEDFRGFSGAVRAKIIKKDPELFELIIAVDRVLDEFKNNKARNARSIEGKQLMLAGFWRRKEVYHSLKVGDAIEVGLQHIGRQSDHLTVHEFVRKADARREERPKQTSENGEPRERRGEKMDVVMQALRGFKGVIIGRLVEKDVERGTFSLTVDRVPRIWQNSRARNPKSLVGTEIRAEGLSGKHLDVLLVARKGETLEFGAFNDDGAGAFRVVELFRKVAPVKPGDYPELPEGFRGFKGEVVAKILKKDPLVYSLTMEVQEIQKSWDGSRAKAPESVVGKTVMLGGFWRRKDQYHSLAPGDTVACGIQHVVQQSDGVTVAERLTVLKKGSSEE